MYGLFNPQTRSDLHIVVGDAAASQSDDPLVFGLGPNQVGAITRTLRRCHCEISEGNGVRR